MVNLTINTSSDLMDNAVSTITRSGASGSLLADYKAIGEATAPDGSSKYSHAPVMVWLAKFVVGAASGPHKDIPIFELCHLVSAIDALGGGEGRASFFLGVEKAMPSAYRRVIDDRLQTDDWLKPGFERTSNGLAVSYGAEIFEIRFGRMPFLAALFEFLISMDGYDFYAELDAIFDDMSEGLIDLDAIKSASNKISARLRQYRRQHLTRAQHDEKFNRIFGFLKSREIDGQINIDDPSVLDFWKAHSTGGEFRAYKTVFDGFVFFMRALEEADLQDTVENASVIGIDFEAHEVEPDDQVDGLNELGSTLGNWESPLNILDVGPAAEIKFFKKEGERKPIENLLHYGPYATRLPRSFLQLETFGVVQSAITTDLQVKRGLDSIRKRIACDDTTAYHDKEAQLQGILKHVLQLQKASFFVLTETGDGDLGDNVVAFGPQNPVQIFEVARNNTSLDLDDIENNEMIMADAERAFKNLTRKGFDESVMDDPDSIEGFRIGAGALLNISNQLDLFLQRMAALDRENSTLADKYVEDKNIFSTQFNMLYRDVL